MATMMMAVRDYSEPPVEDPDRVVVVHALGIDETSLLKANAEHPTELVSGFVDLERHVFVDMVRWIRAIDFQRAHGRL